MTNQIVKLGNIEVEIKDEFYFSDSHPLIDFVQSKSIYKTDKITLKVFKEGLIQVSVLSQYVTGKMIKPMEDLGFEIAMIDNFDKGQFNITFEYYVSKEAMMKINRLLF